MKRGAVAALAAVALSVAYAQITCPDGFTAPPASLFSGYCYKYIGTSQLWSQHEVQCSQATYNGAPWGGGHLATMFDQNSATVVMDNNCNGLATNAQYFIGYYICCGSTAYSSRTDWRWSSTISTTWIHGQSKYLSGAEPDDLGCGRAHGGDDGATPGKIADWYCTSNAVGACCEAPAIPSPSATVTSTRTATSTETATHTRSATATGTRTETATQTRTATSTQTATPTTSRTVTPSVSPTKSVSPTMSVSPSSSVSPSVSPSTSVSVTTSVSPSMSVSPSESVSPSMSVTVTATVTPTISVSISPTPRPLKIGNLDFGANSGASGSSIGGINGGGSGAGANGSAIGGIFGSGLNVGAGYDPEPGLTSEQKIYVAAGAGGAGLLALLALLCCLWWFCVLVPRKKKQKEEMEGRLKRKSQFAKAGRLQKKVGESTRMATMLGLTSPTGKDGTFTLGGAGSPADGKLTPANSPNPLMRKQTAGTAIEPARNGVSSVLGAMNPALLKAKRGSTAAQQTRGPRMTMALAAYKNTAAFKPTTAGGYSRKSTVQQLALLEEDGNAEAYDDAAIGLDDDGSVAEEENNAGETTEGYDENGNYYGENTEGYNNGEYEEEPTAPEENDYGEGEGEGAAEEEDGDYEEDEEAIAAGLGRKVGGKKAAGGGWLSNKTKKSVEQAVAPPTEDKKLVIGRGAVITERVEKQVVMLRRVSKVKGDATMTALRQESAQKFMRPSGVAQTFGSPAGGYAFAATVSRTIEKRRKSSLANPQLEAAAYEEEGTTGEGEGGYDENAYYQGNEEGSGEAADATNYDYESGQYQHHARGSVAYGGSS